MTKAKTAQRKGGGQAPISAHPAFPAIVALWFAALFGIGSMVLPNILIEKIVDATGIAVLIPVAAPPIGFTAKLTLAVIAALGGAAAGVFIARKVMDSQSATKPARAPRKLSRDDEEQAPAKRPISATEELGGEGLGPVDDADDYAAHAPAPSKPPLPGRRRALSVTDDSGPSEYLSQAPLPGEGEAHLPQEHIPVDEAPAQPLEIAVADPANRRDGSNLVPDVETHAQEHAQALDGLRNTGAASAAGEPRPFDVPLAFPGDAPTGGDGADYVAGGEQAMEDQDAPAPLQLGMPEEDNTMNTSEQGFGAGYNPFGDRAEQPADEAPRQVFGEPQQAAFGMPLEEPAAANAPAPDFATQAFAPTSFAPPSQAAAPIAPAAPLAELSMSELIARFARSIQGETAAPVMAEPQPSADDPFEDAGAAVPFAFAPPADTAAAQVATDTPAEQPVGMPPFAAPVAAEAPAPFTAPFAAEANAVPSALRPLDLGEFEEDEDSEDPFANPFGATASEAFGAPGRMFERPAEAAPVAAAEAPAPEPAPLAATAAEQPAPQPFGQAFGQAFGMPELQPQAAAPPEAPAEAPAMPAAFADPLANADEDDDTGNDDAYSSLLSMKSPLGNHREFVRVEDEEEDDTSTAAPEAVVVFPGQAATQQGPAAENHRPFDAPPASAAGGGIARAVPTTPAQKAADPAETERALRDALEKLQRMSGAA